jgi:hypothetical protein
MSGLQASQLRHLTKNVPTLIHTVAKMYSLAVIGLKLCRVLL